MPQLDKLTYFSQFFWFLLFFFTFYILICNNGDGLLGISRIFKLRNQLISNQGNKIQSKDSNRKEEILRKGFSTGVSYMYSILLEVSQWCKTINYLGKSQNFTLISCFGEISGLRGIEKYIAPYSSISGIFYQPTSSSFSIRYFSSKKDKLEDSFSSEQISAIKEIADYMDEFYENAIQDFEKEIEDLENENLDISPPRSLFKRDENGFFENKLEDMMAWEEKKRKAALTKEEREEEIREVREKLEFWKTFRILRDQDKK